MATIPTPEERLERGELLAFPPCPFALPPEDDLTFLRSQRLGLFSHKNISLDPATGRVGGFQRQGSGQVERLVRRENLACPLLPVRQSEGGTAEKSAPRSSAIVGCARMASRKPV